MSRGRRRLDKVEEFARNEERAAARDLADHRQAAARQGEQVEQLRQFLEDYERRFADLAGGACTAAGLKGRRAFMQRLESGLAQARERYDAATAAAGRQETLWSQKSRRLASVQRVIDRRASEQRQRDSRRAARVVELAAARARIGAWSDSGHS